MVQLAGLVAHAAHGVYPVTQRSDAVEPVGGLRDLLRGPPDGLGAIHRRLGEHARLKLTSVLAHEPCGARDGRGPAGRRHPLQHVRRRGGPDDDVLRALKLRPR